MTLHTDQGIEVIPVKVDLMQALKPADEKRQRNAGASARFRVCRKEKAKEATHIITKLEHTIEELRAQRDFYQEERDLIQDIAAEHIATNALLLRPNSPSSCGSVE